MTETVPAGRFVPVEPTEAMIEAGVYAAHFGRSDEEAMAGILRAAIAAAPALPTAEADELRAGAQKLTDAVLSADYALIAGDRYSISIASANSMVDCARHLYAALATTPETASLHEPSIVEGGIKLPSNLPETAKNDTSAAGAEWGAMKQIQSYVMSERTALHPLDPDFNAKYLTLKTVGKRIREILAALHPAPATASSGGMGYAGLAVELWRKVEVPFGKFMDRYADHTGQVSVDELADYLSDTKDAVRSTIEALSKQFADLTTKLDDARDANALLLRNHDERVARIASLEAALAEQSRRADAPQSGDQDNG